MFEIICCVNNELCDIGMCTKCDKFSQDRINKALKNKRKEYDKISQQYHQAHKEYFNFAENISRKYLPSCKCGYTDCILDVEYIKTDDAEWYKTMKLNGDNYCAGCVNGSKYDNEDK